MRHNKQLIVDAKVGDCFRACVTSLLGLPNLKKFPNIDDSEWLWKWHKLLARFGMTLEYNFKACWKSGYWIASVQSKNFEEGTHAIIMKHTRVVWDPSTKVRYKTGEKLLGVSEIVKGGWSLVVTDPSKLHKLEEFRLKHI